MAEAQNALRPLVIADLNPKLNITVVQDGASLQKLKTCVDRIAAETRPVVGLDTETNITVDFYNRRVRTLQVGDKHEQFVVDMLAFSGSEEKLIASQGNYGVNGGSLYAPVFEILDPVLTTGKFLKVGQNIPFEYEVMSWNFGKRIWNLYSTDIAERVIQAGGTISLKQYKLFSMLEIVKRRFGLLINKGEQRGFDLSSTLTQEQIEYAALDIRMPLAIRLKQLEILTKDQLQTTTQIENDAIGSYTDMHLWGQKIDKERWMKRIAATEERRKEELHELDKTFIPIVGHVDNAIDYVELERLERDWKLGYDKPTQQETDKAVEMRLERDATKKAALRAELKALAEQRKAKKAAARTKYSVLGKQRTKNKKILEKCEGEAFLNYGSNDQLVQALKKIKGFSTIDSAADDTLLKYNDRPFIQTLRRYRKGKKDTGTYGVQWTQRWVTKPCKEEGWLHPGDGRLHCQFNQLEAETGRSSSAKPNAQNLPQDDEVRACFVCDPPDESIRISVCCDSDTCSLLGEDVAYVCNKCNQQCETKAEENCIVTVDMSGAELRIIAELAGAKTWIIAFAKDQDVHSVSTEVLYPEKWPSLALPNCTYYAQATERRVLPNGQVIEAGDMLKKKCKCPGHNELRNGTKATNFLLCYGGGPDALADAIGVTVQVAKELMKLHESKFPDVWNFLFLSGENAKRNMEARDMYGRRRLFLEPTPETAAEWYKEYEDARLELSDDEKAAALFNFKTKEMRDPNEEEKWSLTHRPITGKEIAYAMRAMVGSISRKGKNHGIQGTNASIIKRAMGCGFDKNGKAYLWHTLPKYKARQQNMVHDELVLQCPKRFGQQVLDLVGDAFKRAAAEVMHAVVMEHEGHIAERWKK